LGWNKKKAQNPEGKREGPRPGLEKPLFGVWAQNRGEKLGGNPIRKKEKGNPPFGNWGPPHMDIGFPGEKEIVVAKNPKEKMWEKGNCGPLHSVGCCGKSRALGVLGKEKNMGPLKSPPLWGPFGPLGPQKEYGPKKENWEKYGQRKFGPKNFGNLENCWGTQKNWPGPENEGINPPVLGKVEFAKRGENDRIFKRFSCGPTLVLTGWPWEVFKG